MPIEGNLFGDLLKIGGGNVELVSERMAQYSTYANTIPSQPSSPDVSIPETPAAAPPTTAPQVAHR